MNGVYLGECGERKCPVCKKVFCVLNPDIWVYKRKKGSIMEYFCSWSCYRKQEKKDGKRDEYG